MADTVRLDLVAEVRYGIAVIDDIKPKKYIKKKRKFAPSLLRRNKKRCV